MTGHDKTLRLLFPQWQGGNNPSYEFGAQMLAWLAPQARGPIEEVAVASPDGMPLLRENGIVGRRAVLAQVRDARARIDRHRPDRIVVLGGDCGVDLAPFAYLNERYDGDLAVLWVDAHSDLLTKEVFPGAHAHVLGTLLGDGDEEFLSAVKRPLKHGHALVAGVRELPESLSSLRDAEARAMQRRGVRSIGPEALAESSEPVLTWLRETGARHVAVHFDLDVLDPSLFRSLLFSRPGTPVPGTEGIPVGRMTLAQVVRLLTDVSREAEVVGLGVTEHMPWDAMALRDALAAMPLIGSVGEAASSEHDMDRRRFLAVAASTSSPLYTDASTGDTTLSSNQSVPASAARARRVKNIVLVHGAFADGSGWRSVYDELTARGYAVSVVQNPLTSFEDDVAATHRVLNRQNGPAILVGHSYGGTVITEVGSHPKVAALVYVAAFAPEIGQSTLDQYAEIPPPPNFVPEEQQDGFAFLNGDLFRAGFAADVTEADAAFLRDSQVPIALAALKAKVSNAAWRTKPSWYVVATEDGAIAPELLRSTARRIGATTTEIRGSHVVFLTQPKAVAGVIEAAANGVS